MKRYDYLLESISFASALSQTHQVLQIIQLIISLMATAFSFYVTFKVWKEKALKDGKIDKDEIDELHGEIKNTMKDVEEKINKVEKGEKDNG